VAVGGFATLVQYAVLVACVELAGWPPFTSSALGFCLSAAANYALNYRFTFMSSARHRETTGRFLLVAACGLGINTGTMYVLGGVEGLHYLVAQVAATGLALAWNFSAHNLWTFGGRRGAGG